MLSDLEYIRLFDSCMVHAARMPELNMLIDNKILPNKHLPSGLHVQGNRQLISAGTRVSAFQRRAERWQDAGGVTFRDRNRYASPTGMPWYVTACLCCTQDSTLRAQPLPVRNGGIRQARPESSVTASALLNRSAMGLPPGKNMMQAWTLPNILRAMELHQQELQRTGLRDLWAGSNHAGASPVPTLGPAVVLKGLENRGIVHIPRY